MSDPLQFRLVRLADRQRIWPSSAHALLPKGLKDNLFDPISIADSCNLVHVLLPKTLAMFYGGFIAGACRMWVNDRQFAMGYKTRRRVAPKQATHLFRRA